MMVSLDQWHTVIGTFNYGSLLTINSHQPDIKFYMLFAYLYFTQVSLHFSISPSVHLLIFAV